jgi:hypothetical protein
VIGQVLGPYQILSRLGEGGMGEVYKARDTRLNRTVAIKVLPPDVDGVSRLWVRRLDSIASQELPDTDDAQFPFWSPDGRSLAYFARGALRRVDALGGASTVLTSVVEPRGGSWGAGGTIDFSDSVGPLYRISASGGERSSLTRLAAAEVSHRWARFLPDGQTLLFFVQRDRTGAYLTALDRGGAKERVADASVDAAFVPPRGGGPAHLVMIQGDSLVAQPFDLASRRITGPAAVIPGAGSAKTFTGPNRSNLSVASDGTIVYASGSNRYQLTRFDPGGTPVSNVGTPDRYVGLRISPDGSQALTIVDDAVGNRDIWRVDVTTGARTRVTADNRGAFGTWFPDGRRIVFSGQGRQTAFEKSVSGNSGERPLLLGRPSGVPERLVSGWSIPVVYDSATGVRRHGAGYRSGEQADAHRRVARRRNARAGFSRWPVPGFHVERVRAQRSVRTDVSGCGRPAPRVPQRWRLSAVEQTR